MDLFDYTQKKYWGSPWYPYWTLMIATVVFGFFGLDHLWLRSPLSGLIKAITNVLTLGLWYFYDIIQVFTESESVKKHGLSAPILGPLGIGAGMFRADVEGETLSKSPIRYILYVIMLLVPFTFGLEYVVAGDMGGAGFKFLISLLMFIMFPVAIIYTIMNMVHAIAIPKSLFEQGTYHLFPASLFIGPRGTAAAGMLGPRDVPDPNAVCSSGLGAVIQPFMGLLEVAVKNISAPATAAVQAVSGAVTATATAVKTGADIAVKTGETIGSTLDALQGVTSGLGGLTDGLQGQVQKQISEKAQALAIGQTGGAILGPYTPSTSDWLMIAVMCSSSAYFLVRKYKEYFQKEPSKKEEQTYNGIPVPDASSK